MALLPENNFTGRVSPSSPQYPYGSARNVTTSGDGTGTPFVADLVNDLFGFQQSVLSKSNIIPTGIPDVVGNSQYLDALNSLFTVSKSTVADMVTDTDLKQDDKVISYFYVSEVINYWHIKPTGDTTLGDILLNNGLYAVLLRSPVMYPEQFGADNTGVTSSHEAFNRAAKAGVKLQATASDIYLFTDQVEVPVGSGFQFSGGGCSIDWNGVAGAPIIEGRDWGVFKVMGTQGADIDTLTLTTELVEFTESFYYVNNEAAFSGKEDTYMIVFAGTSAQPTLPSFSLMTKFIQVTSGQGRCSLDHRNGWDIPVGLNITYRDVTPIGNIVLEDFTITDKSPTSGDTADYASAISLAFAHHCKINNVTGVGFRNPIVFANFCNECEVSGRIERPQEVGGGQGYYIQWNNSTKCISKVTGYFARHLVDHTKCSYMTVYDSKDTNSQDGAYTNHGAYEHDIAYYNCVGFVSVGNSGASFGETCKRIHVENCNGRKLDADRNIIDLTVINSRFSFVTVNSQGFQADGLTVNDDGSTTGFSLRSTTTALGRNTLSKRPNVIKNSTLILNTNYFLSDFDFTGRVLTLSGCDVVTRISNPILSGAVHMMGGSWNNIANTAILLTGDSSLKLLDVDRTTLGIRQNDGNDNCYVVIDGGEILGGVPVTGLYSNRMNFGATGKVEISNQKLDAGGGIIIDMPETSETNGMFIDISHNTFINGSVTIQNQYSGAGKLVYVNNLLDTVTGTTITTGGRRKVDNIVV